MVSAILFLRDGGKQTRQRGKFLDTAYVNNYFNSKYVGNISQGMEWRSKENKMDYNTGDFCNSVGSCSCWNREFTTDIVGMVQAETPAELSLGSQSSDN